MKKKNLGDLLIEGLTDALAYEHGKKTLRTSFKELPEPAPHWKVKDIKNLRVKVLGLSQPVFASYLSVSADTVKAWEQGRIKPSGASSRLLQFIALEPGIFTKLPRNSQKNDPHHR